ncbi:LacI family transcriptional regulator [Rhizobium lemnae]|uniref:LacI family DNA-binding transcriptional regulator n=1 Tax=Rhizobium lemnae TaxID=1214924 RepID=A0ABV8EG40_9HYPH|nr:LacI family DNA-binding transcriptional regulator [Rhizobium lemnae]MCJ8508889.1 LacI family transcriptional regulator [Rhizobium lemnae]
MKPKPKLTLLAETFNVSVATVSNALSGKGRISPDLAQRIRDKAREIGYVPSSAGRALRTGRSGVLGLVLPDISNPLFPQIAQAIEQAASTRGYGVLIGDARGSSEGQSEAISRLMERGVDGMLVIPRRGTRVTDIRRPLAMIDSPSTPGNTVSADHRDGGVKMGAYLAELGHRHVLIVAMSSRSIVQADRIEGVKQGLGERARVELIFTDDIAEQDGSVGSLGLADYIARGVTAVATLSDLTALRALTELQGAGFSVPDRVSVTGFDDLIWSSAITPGLTTMRADMAEIGRLAVEALVKSIERPDQAERTESGTVKAKVDRVPMALVIRSSSGEARSAETQP